jgi:hypothetical protein
MESDFYYRHEGSIIILFPKTVSAQKWVADKIVLDTWQDPDQISIELPLFDDIVAGILLSGLSISILE